MSVAHIAAEPFSPAAGLWQYSEVSGRPALRLGGRWLALDDVASYDVYRIAERDNEGLLLNFSLFALLACAFVVPVIQDVMAPKFLIAAGLLGAIALMSLSEVFFSPKVEYFRLDLTMHHGAAASFVTGNEADMLAIIKLLEDRNTLRV